MNVLPLFGRAAGLTRTHETALRAATWPRDDRSGQRLLVIDAHDSTLRDCRIKDIAELLRPTDLLVFNDAATLPASLTGVTQAGQRLELRLAREQAAEFWAIVLGQGDFRQRTEDREPPPRLRAGETLTLGDDSPSALRGESALRAVVLEAVTDSGASGKASRLIKLKFEQSGAALWDALYRVGRPIQYSHVARPLALWHVQNVFAARPWAFELPSAAHGFTWDTLLALRRRGLEMATVTHAAGISSTGFEPLDRLLPFPERSEVPERTVQAIERVRRHGGRVVAVGTTVVRALEAAVNDGQLVSGEREATLVLGPRHPAQPKLTREHPVIVDSLITGIHQPGESHYSLLEAFAPRSLLERAEKHAGAHGYLTHEFGDACLVLGAGRQNWAA
jgi:S-adenosylmethionine:tRNA ribosyltransferase-isomerase